ncbi:hypothetical protein MSG28_014868 [Choristoneura fumiferana]|uniref:Uncharacterized protein n=1 Tax=Choristoneura fumiferana TaxID=7141 RepID=A0ACC0JTA1_CHOFU|nr:hypothetical protein MSG28_014868 [Choristoneura fumiferana]
MESAACRRRASDAEQSARWTYSATAECEPVAVKEEPRGRVRHAFYRLEGPCSLKPEGVADDTPTAPTPALERTSLQQEPRAAVQADKLFVRLERLPVGDLHRGKPCSSMQADPSASALWRSREQGQTRSYNLPTPHACHEQDTLNRTEVGPCQLQPAGGAGAAPECTHTRPGEGPRCNMSHDQQFQLRSCSVRLERVLMEDLPTCDTCLS